MPSDARTNTPKIIRIIPRIEIGLISHGPHAAGQNGGAGAGASGCARGSGIARALLYCFFRGGFPVGHASSTKGVLQPIIPLVTGVLPEWPRDLVDGDL